MKNKLPKSKPRRRRPTGKTPLARQVGLGVSTAIDLFDGMIEQLDRMRALADLMTCTDDRLEPPTIHGVGWLLWDLHGRMEKILREAYGGRAEST